MIKTIAKLTRRFHPKGTERILRLFYDPDKRQNDFIETVIPYDKDLKIHINTGSFLDWEIFFKNYYELPIIKLIKKYLPKGGVFVDVGANIGCHSLIASKIAKKVIALEPVKIVAERLKSNCELNNLGNVSILQLAASDEEGIVSFYKTKDKSSDAGMGTLCQHARPEKDTEEIKVESKTLDNILREEKVDFIKIDADGYDGKVILGAIKTIEKYHPVIVFEYCKDFWDSSGIYLNAIEDLLISKGYVLTRLGKIRDYFNELCLYKPKK